MVIPPTSQADAFEIAYPDYDNRTAETANGIAYISGALTPTSGNPVFRVYDIDPDTYEVMDFVPYYGDLFLLVGTWLWSNRQLTTSFLASTRIPLGSQQDGPAIPG